MRQRSANLDLAKKAKFDEFYTIYGEIEKELSNYDKEQFKDKIVYVNCDDPKFSNFWKYFYNNFQNFKLKKLVSTYLSPNAVKTEYDGKTIKETPLTQGGSFDSLECLEELKKSDIIATNPPFSLYRELFKYITRYDKKFILIGNLNAVSYIDTMPYVVAGEITCGCYTKQKMWFKLPDEYNSTSPFSRKVGNDTQRRLGNISWYSNLKHKDLRKVRDLIKYDPKIHPFITTYKWTIHQEELSRDEKIIECNSINKIPYDYDGYIAVPLTIFKNKLNAEYEIVDLLRDVYIGNRATFRRFAIKIKNPTYKMTMI